MNKFIEKYQILFGFAAGALILGLILSCTIYFLGIKDKFASPAYANTNLLSPEAVVDCLGIDKGGYAYLLSADGSIKKSDGTTEYPVIDLSAIGGGFLNNTDYPTTAVLPFNDGYYAIKADGTYAKKSSGFNSAPAAVFQNGRYVHFCNSTGRIINSISIDPPAQNMPDIDIKDIEPPNTNAFYGYWDGRIYKFGFVDRDITRTTQSFDFHYPDQSSPATRGPVLLYNYRQ